MNVGKTLFAQIMRFVPWKAFENIVDEYNGDHHVRTLDCADVFRILAFAQLTWRESLRDIEACLSANQNKLFHLGFKGAPAKSTLADALNNRDWRIYHDLAMKLIARARKLYATDTMNVDLDATVYALDSTTIDLCLSLFDWALFRSKKGAIKLHTLLDLRGNIPAFIHISNGKMADVKILDWLLIEAGAFYIMDRAYLDFARLYNLHQRAGFFVTRAKSGMRFNCIRSHPVSDAADVICDQVIQLSGLKAYRNYPEYLRRICFIDRSTYKTLIFLTNNHTLPASTIAALYKNRWQVELFFKWIKQHLRIKRFLGTSENAVKAQIWCAISTYVLIAIIKKELSLETSLYKMLQILSISVFEKMELKSVLSLTADRSGSELQNLQLSLFQI